MARAHRHFVPGHIWHITHRCHNKRFLLERAEDRQEWLFWLEKAKKRFDLPVLGYAVTCNHIHLLVQDPGKFKAIAKSMQLMQGQFAQNYNQKMRRESAFWGDRYHATAVESGTHLLRCIAYINLNMVRAGAVADPADWHECGYREIQMDRPRRQIIDRGLLANLVGASDIVQLRRIFRDTMADSLINGKNGRDSRWTESLAIGSQQFVNAFSESLGKRSRGKHIVSAQNKNDSAEAEPYVLREPPELSYGKHCWGTQFLPGENTVLWDKKITA